MMPLNNAQQEGFAHQGRMLAVAFFVLALLGKVSSFAPYRNDGVSWLFCFSLAALGISVYFAQRIHKRLDNITNLLDTLSAASMGMLIFHWIALLHLTPAGMGVFATLAAAALAAALYLRSDRMERYWQ